MKDMDEMMNTTTEEQTNIAMDNNDNAIQNDTVAQGVELGDATAEAEALAAATLSAQNDFNAKLHVIGRLWTLVGILLFLAVPVIMCIHFKETPDWAVFGTAAVLIPLLLNTFSGVGEPIIYAPMLGTSGEYLAFITGNLANLKIPCVVKAQEIADTKMGTEENELVSTIAIATSSLVTILIIAVIVILLAFSGLTQAIENSTFITPAFGAVVYALFGALGGRYIVKNPKFAIIPAAIMILVGILKISTSSIALFIGIAVCAIYAIIQFKVSKKAH